MSETQSGLARSAQILGFLMNTGAGVFTGRRRPPRRCCPAGGSASRQFVEDLEALGPTFGRSASLSTRPPGAALTVALERMQESHAGRQRDIRAYGIETRRALNSAFSAFATTVGAALASASGARGRPTGGGKGPAAGHRTRSARPRRAVGPGRRVAAAPTSAADALRGLVNEFRKTLLLELDYRVEAENLDRFESHFADYPTLFVPRPVWDLTSPRVLTMELVEGTKVTDISGMRRAEEDLGALAATLMRAYLDQMFVHGEIHADPHPGNLFLTRDTRLALLDLGMVAHVPPGQRERC